MVYSCKYYFAYANRVDLDLAWFSLQLHKRREVFSFFLYY